MGCGLVVNRTVLEEWLDLMILKVLSNPNDSMIPWIKSCCAPVSAKGAVKRRMQTERTKLGFHGTLSLLKWPVAICQAPTSRTLGIPIKFSLWKHHANPNTVSMICRVQELFNLPLPKGFGAIAALTYPILDAFLILGEG